jgi:hypothetical protein
MFGFTKKSVQATTPILFVTIIADMEVHDLHQNKLVRRSALQGLKS